MKRLLFPRSDNQVNLTFNPNVGLTHCILREQSIVDEFYFEQMSPSDDSSVSFSVVDPIYILFNQTRIENMGVSAAKAFLDSLVPQSNSLSELRSKVSDDDLMCMIKSRHLQAPCEILAWCRYMNSNVEKLNSELAELANIQAIQEQKEVEPKPQ